MNAYEFVKLPENYPCDNCVHIHKDHNPSIFLPDPPFRCHGLDQGWPCECVGFTTARSEPLDGTYPPDLRDTDFDYEIFVSKNDLIMANEESWQDLLAKWELSKE